MDVLVDGPEDAAVTTILAHGAGGPMRSPFMRATAEGLAKAGIRAVRFDFPYMTAKKKVPDREPVLLDAWREVIRKAGHGLLVIGGKSLGGRMASMIADEMKVRGLVCLGYPFHPPGKPEKTRTAHLANLQTPTLIVQGTRDPFGGRVEVEGYTLSPAVRIHWIEGGDHSLKTPASKRQPDPLADVIATVTRFIREVAV